MIRFANTKGVGWSKRWFICGKLKISWLPKSTLFLTLAAVIMASGPNEAPRVPAVISERLMINVISFSMHATNSISCTKLAYLAGTKSEKRNCNTFDEARFFKTDKFLKN